MTVRELLRHPLVISLIVLSIGGIGSSAYQAWHGLSNLPDKEWMQDHFASKDDVQSIQASVGNFSQRLTWVEDKAKGLDQRQRGIIQSLQTVCAKQNIACPIRNALYHYPPIPPWPQLPSEERIKVAAHEKRRMHVSEIKPTA